MSEHYTVEDFDEVLQDLAESFVTGYDEQSNRITYMMSRLSLCVNMLRSSTFSPSFNLYTSFDPSNTKDVNINVLKYNVFNSKKLIVPNQFFHSPSVTATHMTMKLSADRKRLYYTVDNIEQIYSEIRGLPRNTIIAFKDKPIRVIFKLEEGYVSRLNISMSSSENTTTSILSSRAQSKIRYGHEFSALHNLWLRVAMLFPLLCHPMARRHINYDTRVRCFFVDVAVVLIQRNWKKFKAWRKSAYQACAIIGCDDIYHTVMSFACYKQKQITVPSQYNKQGVLQADLEANKRTSFLVELESDSRYTSVGYCEKLLYQGQQAMNAILQTAKKDKYTSKKLMNQWNEIKNCFDTGDIQSLVNLTKYSDAFKALDIPRYMVRTQYPKPKPKNKRKITELY